MESNVTFEFQNAAYTKTTIFRVTPTKHPLIHEEWLKGRVTFGNVTIHVDKTSKGVTKIKKLKGKVVRKMKNFTSKDVKKMKKLVKIGGQISSWYEKMISILEEDYDTWFNEHVFTQFSKKVTCNEENGSTCSNVSFYPHKYGR